MPIDINTHLQILRQKAITGDLSIEEMREAIKMLRENRMNAAKIVHKTRRKEAVANSDKMLDELEGL